ncbi:MAG: DUF4249 domain-containing protein [Bacteroidales bacterium]|nr:DUF4249 domain-containing protein [Bacteroidales bacterium]
MKRSIFYKLLPLFAISLILTSACTERYDIKLDESFTRLVVDGNISTETTGHLVRLTTTTSYFSNDEPPPVTEAVVYLDNGVGRLRLTEDKNRAGYYFTPNDFFGLPGTKYTLEINLKDKIGDSDRYEAVTQMPLTNFQIDSIVLEYQALWDFYLVKLYAYDPPSTDFYKFDALINGKMITDTASRSLIVDDRFFNGNNTNGLGVMFIRPDEVTSGDTVTLIMSSVSKEFYDFFVQLRTESGPSNPLFSGPPANIASNVKEGGLGFFDARILQKVSIIAPGK